ncbi:MAG: hypothetical protein ACRD3I_04035, partial [Terriglobales bacterium]
IEGAVAGGHPRSRTKFFTGSEEAAKFVAEFLAPRDLLLVKGSRGVKMERIVEALLARETRVRGGAPRPVGEARR